ncbi:MAG: hypothetical protein OFPII_16080 [Osedax symbiont Rs1]|nr:MAG: hypothetical protein OFPII_16080 [Osedax symbiont Rs1]
MIKLLLLALALLPHLSHASGFPLPADTIVSSVSQRAHTLGMTLSIQKFESKLSKAKLLAYYQKLWGANGVQSTMEPWDMLGAKLKTHYYNVQVQSAGMGSRGYLSISDLPKLLENKQISKAAMLGVFPKMGGSKIVDNQKHTDLLNTSNTVQIRNHFSVSANSQFYLNHYRHRGWVLQNDTQHSGLKGRVLLLAKGERKLSLTINNLAGESYIVANLSRAN